MSRPFISVVIPAFNEEATLPKCLQSLRQQTYSNYEIIVVNNNSTDQTHQVAQTAGVQVAHESQRGVCFARQCGALQAKGDIIVSTDADCAYSPNWLANIARQFANEKIVAVTGPYQFESTPRWGARVSRTIFMIANSFYKLFGRVYYVGASNFAFRKDIWQKIGGYNTSLAQAGDELDMLRKLRPMGQTIYLHDNIVHTSSRRLKKGFFYNIFVTSLWYYFADYFIATRITGKSVLGHYPAFRDPVESPKEI